MQFVDVTPIRITEAPPLTSNKSQLLKLGISVNSFTLQERKRNRVIHESLKQNANTNNCNPKF